MTFSKIQQTHCAHAPSTRSGNTFSRTVLMGSVLVFILLIINSGWAEAGNIKLTDAECFQTCKDCFKKTDCIGRSSWKGKEAPCNGDWYGSLCRCSVTCPYKGNQCVPAADCKP